MSGPEVWELEIAVVDSSPLAPIFYVQEDTFFSVIDLKNECFTSIC